MATLEKGDIKFDNEDSTWAYIKGKAQWAKVIEAGEEYKGKRWFEVDLYVSDEDLEEYITMAKEVADLAQEASEEFGKYTEVQDEFTKEDKDGKTFLKFKLEYREYKGVFNKVDIYDKNGKKDENWDALIGNGSEVKIKYRLAPYVMQGNVKKEQPGTAGASVRFFALQVIDLVEYSGGGDESGFGDESGQSGRAEAPFDADGADF